MHHFIALTILLLALTASAQPGPIFMVEHDWTLHADGRSFGMYQYRVLGDVNGSYTTVCFGRRSLMMHAPAGWLLAGILAPLAVCGAVMWMRGERSATS